MAESKMFHNQASLSPLAGGKFFTGSGPALFVFVMDLIDVRQGNHPGCFHESGKPTARKFFQQNVGSSRFLNRRQRASFRAHRGFIKRQYARTDGPYLASGYSRQSSPSWASCCRTSTRSHTCTRRPSTLTARRRPSGLRALGALPVGRGRSSSAVRAS